MILVAVFAETSRLFRIAERQKCPERALLACLLQRSQSPLQLNVGGAAALA